MKRQYLALLVLLLLLASLLLIACQPGHDGAKVVGYLKDGQLWTADADGANQFAIAKQDVPVVGFSWSPNHQIVAFRTMDTDFARSAEARRVSGQPLSGLIADIPSAVNTVGVDGGTPIVVAFSNPNARYSNAIWNTTGNRLLIRQTAVALSPQPGDASWWVTQNDQPGGIAAKTLPASYSFPSLGYTNNLVAGNSLHGLFTASIAGTDQRYLTRQQLAGHPLPAALERVLWQPGRQDASLLYAVATHPQQASSSPTPEVRLILRTPQGTETPLLTCACTQFAWSPNGDAILYATNDSLSVFTLQTKQTFSFPADAESIPSWSPDGRMLLLSSAQSLKLVDVSNKHISTLLSATPDAREQGQVIAVPANRQALLQPLANSPWSANGSQVLFLTQQRLYWQGKPLAPGEGLYTVSLNNNGTPQATPVLVDKGKISQPGWTYQDPNTSFLF